MDVPGLKLEPRGGTPLLDAMGDLIDRTGKRLATTDESQRPETLLFLVITDGADNASHRYTKAQIKALVERQTKEWKWNFSFLGANVDAFADAAALGIRADASSNYVPTADGVKHAYRGLSNSVTRMRAGGGFKLDADKNTPSTVPAVIVTP